MTTWLIDKSARSGEQARTALRAAPLVAMPVEYLTVPHFDKNVDLIADVTGQPVERLRMGA